MERQPTQAGETETPEKTQAAETKTDKGSGAESNNPRTFTQDEVEAMLKKEYAKTVKRLESKQAEQAEAARLEKLSGEEKTKAELEAANKKLAEYAQKDLVSQFKIELTAKGLPSEFADSLQIGKAEEAHALVKVLSDFKSGIEKAQAEKITKLEEELRNANLRSTTPPKAGGFLSQDKPEPRPFI